MAFKNSASLSSFTLINFNISLEPDISVKGGMTFELTNEIEIGEALPKKSDLPIIHTIKLNINITGKSKINSEAEIFTCHGTYMSAFKLAKEAKKSDSANLKDDDEFVNGLIAQTVPLAMTHIKSQMQIMGLDTRSLPIGMPN